MKYEASYSQVRKNLRNFLEQVCTDHIPLLVTRRKGDNVMLVSEDDYRSLEETAYLSKSPKNLQRLLQALNRKQGKTLEQVRKELRV